MQAADLGDLDYPTTIDVVDFPTLGAVHLQRLANAPFMVVAEGKSVDATQVRLVEHDHVVETLSADGADKSFGEGIWTRTSSSGEDFLEAHAREARPECLAVDLVAISQKVLRWIHPRERLDHLLYRPPGRRVLSDVEVEHTASKVGEDQEHEENLVADSREDKEVDGDYVPDMVLEGDPPRSGWWCAPAAHVILHR
jgi:hypothetical protein